MSQNSQDAIDVLSKVIVDTIEKKLNDAKFDKSQTGVVTAVSGNTYTISVFGSQYNITSDQIYTVGQSVVVTALQGDMKRLVCSPDNIGTMKTVDSKKSLINISMTQRVAMRVIVLMVPLLLWRQKTVTGLWVTLAEMRV